MSRDIVHPCLGTSFHLTRPGFEDLGYIRRPMGEHAFDAAPEPGDVVAIEGREWIVAQAGPRYLVVRPFAEPDPAG